MTLAQLSTELNDDNETRREDLNPTSSPTNDLLLDSHQENNLSETSFLFFDWNEEDDEDDEYQPSESDNENEKDLESQIESQNIQEVERGTEPIQIGTGIELENNPNFELNLIFSFFFLILICTFI